LVEGEIWIRFDVSVCDIYSSEQLMVQEQIAQ
jgi:hypothetical protein